MNKFVQSKQEDHKKAIGHFEKDISSLRAGRASAAILDSVFVDVYGAKSLLNAVASISVEDAHSIVVAPWDKSVLKNIEKGIVEASLGVGVVNEGARIRVNIPAMTEENRKSLVKQLNEKRENARVVLRKIRDEIKKEIEAAARDKEIAEDDKFRFLEELEEETHKVIDEIQAISDKKEQDIMTV